MHHLALYYHCAALLGHQAAAYTLFLIITVLAVALAATITRMQQRARG